MLSGFKTKWFFEVVLKILFWLFPAYIGTHSNCFRMPFAESSKLVSLKTVGDLDFCTDRALVGGREGSGWQRCVPSLHLQAGTLLESSWHFGF